MEKVISILAHYELEADHKLAVLAKRAARYGQAISWQKSHVERGVSRVRWDGKKVKRMVAYVDYVVVGEAPRVGEFVFLAELEIVEGGVLIAGQEVGDIGRNWKGECEHCNSKRYRRLGYVVEGPEGRKVVGKSCLRDHMGVDCPAKALYLFQFERSLDGFGEDEDGGWGGCGRWQDSVLGVVAGARAAIALWGWAPAGHDNASSAYAVGLLGACRELSDSDRKIKDELEAELAKNGDHYERAAQEVIDWGAALEPRGDYEHNLKVALNAEFCRQRTFGLVVSAAAAFDRQVARELEHDKARREREAEAVIPSHHIGKVGERIVRKVKLVRKYQMPDNGFGPSIAYGMRAEDGAKISWLSGTSPRLNGRPLEVGDEFEAKFSIKAHSEYKGVPETRVSRLAIV